MDQRFIPLTPVRARAVVVGLLIVIGIGSLQQQTVAPPDRDPASIGDTALHLRTIERIRRGEPYYSAVGAELRAQAYPTQAVVNWRTPLHYEAMAALSVERAGPLLFVLGMAVIVTGALVYSRHSVSRALVGGLFLFGAMAPVLVEGPAAAAFPERWAGLFVALSLVAYVAGRPVPAAILGVFAVFVRELAIPYALVCGVLALYARRRRESLVWVIGGVAYALYYVAHVQAVTTAAQPGDLVHSQSYLQYLGPSFVFMTLYTYGGLTLLPALATPVAASFGMMSLFAPSAPRQLTISLLLYVALFSVVGLPFNFYWGFFTCALWGHAFVYAAEGGRVLLAEARARRI